MSRSFTFAHLLLHAHFYNHELQRLIHHRKGTKKETENCHIFIFQMGDNDKDYRFMALNDLIAEMGKESFTLDPDGQRKIIRKVLELVVDPSSDVQGLAVKWYRHIENQL